LLADIPDLLRPHQGLGAGHDPSGPGITTLPGQL
jgi:large conductance mechanosensitive channel